MTKRKKLAILALVTLVVVAILLLRPLPSYEMAHVHPSIRGLQQPFRSVTVEWYLDGGSIGMDITDRDGKLLQLAIPVDEKGRRNFHRLFVGAKHSLTDGAVEIEFTQDTRLFLYDAVSYFAKPDTERDVALIALQGLTRDYVKFFLKALLSRVCPQ
jgi:hypothetical protein